jgi:hypothetical protein
MPEEPPQRPVRVLQQQRKREILDRQEEPVAFRMILGRGAPRTGCRLRLETGLMPQVKPSPLGYRLRLLESYLRRSPACPGPPPTAIIATTHRCNMACRMCLRAVRTFNGPNMGFDLFRRIIDGSSPHLRYLSLDGPGPGRTRARGCGMDPLSSTLMVPSMPLRECCTKRGPSGI